MTLSSLNLTNYEDETDLEESGRRRGFELRPYRGKRRRLRLEHGRLE